MIVIVITVHISAAPPSIYPFALMNHALCSCPSRLVNHMGGINRLRSCPQQPGVVAVWGENAQVKILDGNKLLKELAGEEEPSAKAKNRCVMLMWGTLSWHAGHDVLALRASLELLVLFWAMCHQWAHTEFLQRARKKCSASCFTPVNLNTSANLAVMC